MYGRRRQVAWLIRWSKSPSPFPYDQYYEKDWLPLILTPGVLTALRLVFFLIMPLLEQRNDSELFDMYDKSDSRQIYPGWRVMINRE